MEPEILHQLILGSVPPGVAGLVLALVLARAPSEKGAGGARGADRNWRDLSLPPALAIVYVATHVLIFGRPEFPPASSTDAMPIVALVGAVAGVLVTMYASRTVLKVVAVVTALTLLGWLGVRTLSSWWTGAERAWHIGVVVTTVVLGSLNVLGAETLIRRGGARLGVGTIAIALTGIAQILVLGFYSLTLGQAAGVGAAVLTGALVGLLLRRGSTVGAGTGVVPVSVAVVALLQGVVFGDSVRPVPLGVLGACALPVGGLVCALVPRGVRAGGRALAVLVAVLVPLAVAVTLAVADWTGREGEGESDQPVSQGVVQEIPSC